MEDVLDLYARPVDPARPLVCFDEGGKELHADTRSPQPPAPGRAARADYEHARHGSANLFLWTAPHLGRRGVAVTAQRTAIDWALAMGDLVDVQFPAASRVVLVVDNLNTHAPASLYRAFPPAEAQRIRDKLELHYTPKHGSWLNIAELELSVLLRQCLARRIPDRAALAAEVAAWAARRNAAQVGVDWHFTSADARTKLKHLYPVVELDDHRWTDH
jgi:DDE superfamily endonuclease